MTTYVALLRGVNLGSRNKIPMKGLRELVEQRGFENVQTYVQSGNVIFSAPASKAKTLGSDLEAAIATTFGIETPVIIRTTGQLEKVIETNPFPVDDPKLVHVAFLEDRPSAQAIRSLDADRSPPDEFAVKGREIFLHYPKGSGRSKLTLDYFERILATRGTARNFNTVMKLFELMTATG